MSCNASTADKYPANVLGPGLVCWRGIWLWAVDHRFELRHLRDLLTGQGGRPPPQLRRRGRLLPAPRHRRRNRRRVDGPIGTGASRHRSWRRSLPARDGGARALRRGHRTTHRAGLQRLLHPCHRQRLRQDGRPILHHRPPAPKSAQPDRGHNRDGLDAHPCWMAGDAEVPETT